MGIYNLTRAQLDASLAADGMAAASRADALAALDAAGGRFGHGAKPTRRFPGAG